VWRASLAELFGTGVLVFAMDTIVISSYETQIKTPNLIISALVSLAVTLIVLAIVPISGGHVNPAITIVAALMGLVSLSRAAIYVLAQCLGAIAGALALKAVVNSTIQSNFSLGGCTINIVAPGPNGPIEIGLETAQALWMEIICTFVFLFISVRTAFDKRQAKSLGQIPICAILGLSAGLVVFISTTVTATKGYGGVGMNPARCLGPALIRGGHLWAAHWLFWVGPVTASLSFVLFTKIIPREHLECFEIKQKKNYLNNMWRAAFTELVATSCLLFTLTISIISCLESHEAEPKLLVPLAVFLVAFFFLLTTIPLSGGHMSPIFSFIAALKGVITLVRALFYVIAQCLGSILAYLVIRCVMDVSAEEKFSLGGCMVNRDDEGISTRNALILEFSCTFVVLFLAVTVAFDQRRFKELGLLMICVILAGAMALAIFMSIYVTGRPGYGGVGLNPARCLGPALLRGGELWNGHWVFWVGPFLACVVYYGYSLTLPKKNRRQKMKRKTDDLL
ncbi:hypothetical protein Tsubulata_004338, partial [Turnera subulata]